MELSLQMMQTFHRDGCDKKQNEQLKARVHTIDWCKSNVT